MRLKVPSFLLSVPFILLLSACGDEAKKDAPAAAGSPPAQVTAIAAVRDTLYLREETLGAVQAKQAPTIGSEVAARVLAVRADEGDSVRAGDLLAELDSGDFSLTRDRSAAEIKRLEALLENQQRQLERNQRMLERSLVAQSVVDDADAELRALQGQLAAERANFSQASAISNARASSRRSAGASNRA